MTCCSVRFCNCCEVQLENPCQLSIVCNAVLLVSHLLQCCCQVAKLTTAQQTFDRRLGASGLRPKHIRPVSLGFGMTMCEDQCMAVHVPWGLGSAHMISKEPVAALRGGCCCCCSAQGSVRGVQLKSNFQTLEVACILAEQLRLGSHLKMNSRDC